MNVANSVSISLYSKEIIIQDQVPIFGQITMFGTDDIWSNCNVWY